MLIQEMAGPLIVEIVHWVNVLLIIAIIAKLFMLLKSAFGGMSFGGIGGNSAEKAQKKADKKADKEAKRKEKKEDKDKKKADKEGGKEKKRQEKREDKEKKKEDKEAKRKEKKEDKEAKRKEKEQKKKEKQDKYDALTDDDFYKVNGLDPSKIGTVRFRVLDANGNPLMRAKVIYWPAQLNKKAAASKKFKHLMKKQNTGLTLPNGFTSNFQRLQAGNWKVIVVKYGFTSEEMFNKWKGLLNLKAFPVTKYKSEPEVIGITGQENNKIIPINMRRTVDDGFSPVILDVDYSPGRRTGNKVLKLRGIIR